MDLSHPLFTLDPYATDVHAEAEWLLAAGPVVPVDVVGVAAWAVSHHAVAQQILEDPRFLMNSRNWGALQRGEVPEGDELVDTLILALAAGHQTTINFFTNSLLALITHPDQLELLRAGEVSWETVTESALAWDSPVSQSPFRYPAQDVEIEGTLIRRGEPVMMSYAALGRDPAHHGPLAASFDVARGTRHCPSATDRTSAWALRWPGSKHTSHCRPSSTVSMPNSPCPRRRWSRSPR